MLAMHLHEFGQHPQNQMLFADPVWQEALYIRHVGVNKQKSKSDTRISCCEITSNLT
jgi:hypothetical protein